MGRPAGLPKTGGRGKGTPNRKTVLLREALDAKGISPVNRLCDLLVELTPKDQTSVLLELLPYLYPRRKPTDEDDPNRSQEFQTFADMVRAVGQSTRAIERNGAES